MADGPLTLYQAEWCPFSSAVREVLTELGLDFVARQVEPWPSERSGLREVAGTDQIPVLETEDGRFFRGTREIFAHLHAGSSRRRTGAASPTTATPASPTRPGSWSSTSGHRRARGLGRPAGRRRGCRRPREEPLRAPLGRSSDRPRGVPAP